MQNCMYSNRDSPQLSSGSGKGLRPTNVVKAQLPEIIGHDPQH